MIIVKLETPIKKNTDMSKDMDMTKNSHRNTVKYEFIIDRTTEPTPFIVINHVGLWVS